MTWKTKDLIQKYYSAFNDKDWNTFFDCLSDNIIHDINQSETEIGKNLFIDFMKHMNKCYEEKIENLTIMQSESGDRAAAEFIVEGQYLATDGQFLKANGQKYTLPAGAFFEIKNSKITRVTNYYNIKKWIQQVSK